MAQSLPILRSDEQSIRLPIRLVRPERIAVAKGYEFGAMLETGEFDALLSADVPSACWSTRRTLKGFFQTSKTWSRTTTGARASSRSCTVAVRRELLAEHPGLAQAIYQGFCDSKRAAEEKYRQNDRGRPTHLV